MGTSTTGHISNSYAAGALTAATHRIGGLIGTIDNTTITNSFWDMTASAANTAFVTNNTAGVPGISGLTALNAHKVGSYYGWNYILSEYTKSISSSHPIPHR